MTDSRVAFVSGANRGIGFGLTTHLADRGATVFASYRSQASSRELIELGDGSERIFPVRMDTTVSDDIARVVDGIAADVGRIDVLINNAGIALGVDTSVQRVDWREVATNFEVNVGGPLLTTQHFHPLLRNGTEKKILNITSQMGSIEQSGGDWLPYRVSKAALNMLSRIQAEAYRSDGIAVIAVSPGWVRTDMGGANAELSVDESVGKLLRIVNNMTLDDTGSFLSVDGEPVPW